MDMEQLVWHHKDKKLLNNIQIRKKEDFSIEFCLFSSYIRENTEKKTIPLNSQEQFITILKIYLFANFYIEKWFLTLERNSRPLKYILV